MSQAHNTPTDFNQIRTDLTEGDAPSESSNDMQTLAESEVFHIDAEDGSGMPQLNEATLGKAFDALRKQGKFKAPNMTNRIRRYLQQQQLKPQLDRQEQARQLEEWRKKPNADRVTLAEVQEAGAQIGLNLLNTLLTRTIRGAMRYNGYQLGLM